MSTKRLSNTNLEVILLEKQRLESYKPKKTQMQQKSNKTKINL